jgi:hypothetical protein
MGTSQVIRATDIFEDEAGVYVNLRFRFPYVRAENRHQAMLEDTRQQRIPAPWADIALRARSLGRSIDVCYAFPSGGAYDGTNLIRVAVV